MRYAIPAVLVLAGVLPAAAADPPGAVIRVAVTYPGADARTLDETVLTPLFRQINGVEGMTLIESEARTDGTGTVTVSFHPAADPDLAEVRVHNRVSLALPRLPEPCRQLGVSVRKAPAAPHRIWLALTTTDTTQDEKDLQNYAMVYLKPEFDRVLGVTDVRVIGAGDFGIRVLVNSERLRAYQLSAGNVVDALRRQNPQAGAAGPLGGERSGYTVTASGRLTKTEEFGNVILRANPNGEVLRVKDVARVELGNTLGGLARVDGKPAALIAVTAWPGRVTAGRFLKAEGVDNMPPGMRCDVVADRAADRLVAVEVEQPPGSSLERTEAVVAQATDLIRGLPGKPATFAFAEPREPAAATIFVRVRANGGPTAADVDKALSGLAGVKVRVGDVSPGSDAFPARIALIDPTEFRDPGERGEERFREAAGRVLERLAKDGDVAEPGGFPLSREPQRAVDIDRDKCGQRGVEITDVLTTLQTSLGGVHATDFHVFAQTFRVTVQTDPRFARFIEDLEHLFVRNDRGEMVPLSALMKVRKTSGPTAVVRVNGYRAVIVTAAPAGGKTPAEAAARCMKLAEEVLPRGYRVRDLTGASD
jgi:multidrug efflux pump subunit AcrB